MDFRNLFCTLGLAAACSLSASTLALGQATEQPLSASPEEKSVISGGALVQPAAITRSVEACWDDWKARENLQEGKNPRNGYFVYLSHQKSPVLQEPGSSSWVTARNQAVSYAEMTARKSLAEAIAVDLKSSRSSALTMLGGDEAPPSLQPVVQQLSLADKTRVLADKALDNEIKKYDPKWSGNGATDKDRREHIARMQLKIEQEIASEAAMFVSGAFTAVQCEGPSVEDKGRYSVLVALIWSPKLAWVAESIWNPSLELARESARASLKDQFAGFKAENPEWMAYVSGARVFTDETGERVIVGFGAVPQSSLMPADKSRANLLAMAAIQRFVGEQTEAKSGLKERSEHREFTSGATALFDTSSYEERIQLRSKQLELKGIVQVDAWRGEHPFAKAGMQVVAVAWTRRWAADSNAIGDAMRAVERRMEQQGAVPQTGDSRSPSGKAGSVATPARSGAGVSTSDF